MCKIKDLVELRAINPPLNLRVVRFKNFSLEMDYQNTLTAVIKDPGGLLDTKIWEIRTNELLIDALEAGYQIEEGEDRALIAENWLNKYGFIAVSMKSAENLGAGILSPSLPHALLNCFVLVYTDFCCFLKAKYGYDVLPHSQIQQYAPSICAESFYITYESKQSITFNGASVKIQKNDTTLLNALSTMLAQYVSTDNGWQQFTCITCGKISLRRNPKQCYCNECSKKRYQISRQKKRLEGR